MLIQSAQDPNFAETVLRVIQNAATATLTLTAASIAVGAPVVLATATASLPSTDVSAGQNFVQRAATATSLVNNLFVGLLSRVPGTKTYLAQEEVGLAQCYGPVISGAIHRATAGASVGQALIPDSTGLMVAVGGPVTAAATASAGHVEVPAIGLLAVLMEAVATSSATEASTARMFLRCM
jgi:hypothetical protein